jgi:ABC-type branched-subunit amino acid transport system substrate-binding protein
VLYATDPAYFMKQASAAGIDATVIGSDYLPAAQEIAGAAFDDYLFASDFFPVSDPPNPLSQLFIDSWKEELGGDPQSFYAANYWETTLAYWQVAIRAAKAGGDPNDGTDLDKAMLENPTFPSVYGGDDETVGELVLDPETHTPTGRQLGLFQASSDGEPVAKAYFGIGGADFQLVEG